MRGKSQAQEPRTPVTVRRCTGGTLPPGLTHLPIINLYSAPSTPSPGGEGWDEGANWQPGFEPGRWNSVTYVSPQTYALTLAERSIQPYTPVVCSHHTAANPNCSSVIFPHQGATLRTDIM